MGYVRILLCGECDGVRWQREGLSLHGSIIECTYDADHQPPHTWTFMRIREDKSTANHESTVKRIMQSIQDGVDADEV